MALTATGTLPATIPSGEVLQPGVYHLSRTGSLSGVLTLNGNGTFVIQVPSAFAVGAGTSVVLTGGALASDVFWAIGNTVTFGTDVTFVGTVMADNAIIVGAGTTIAGSLFGAEAISLSDNIIGL